MHQNDSAGPDHIHPEEALSRTLGAYFDRPVHRERSLPAGTWRVDGVISLVGVDCDGLGPLGRLLANRLIAVEFFSRPPGLVPFRRAVIKGMWLQADEKTAELATASLILMEGEPTKTLHTEEFTPWASVCGVWIRRREAFCAVAVDTRRIQGLPGWTVWPLVRPIELVRTDDLRAFAEDETIDEERRRRVMGVIEELADKAGRVDLRQVGFEVGLAEGKRLGFDEGQRAALLELARALLGPDSVRELEAIDDTEALRQQLEARLARATKKTPSP